MVRQSFCVSLLAFLMLALVPRISLADYASDAIFAKLQNLHATDLQTGKIVPQAKSGQTKVSPPKQDNVSQGNVSQSTSPRSNSSSDTSVAVTSLAKQTGALVPMSAMANHSTISSPVSNAHATTVAVASNDLKPASRVNSSATTKTPVKVPPNLKHRPKPSAKPPLPAHH